MTLFFVSREDEWALGEKELAFQKVATYVATFIDKILKQRLRCVWDEATSCSYFRGTGAFLAHPQLLKSCGHQTTPSQPLPISSLNTRPNQWIPVGRHSSSRVDLGEPYRSALGPSPRIQFPLCQDPWMCSKLFHYSGPSGPQVIHLGCTWTWHLSEQAVNRRQYLRVTWPLSLCIRLIQSSSGVGVAWGNCLLWVRFFQDLKPQRCPNMCSPGRLQPTF